MMTLISFLVVLGFLAFFHELGHFIVAKRSGIRVEEFGFGYPPRLFTIFKLGGTEYTINAIPFGGFVRLLGEDNPMLPGGFASKGKFKRFATLVAGSSMNILLAFFLFSFSYTMKSPEIIQFNVMIGKVVKGAPADVAGLKAGDIVLKADDEVIEEPQELVDYTHSKLGEEIILEVNREGEILHFRVIPRLEWPEGQGPMGVEIGLIPTRIRYKSYPWYEAIWRGLKHTLASIVFILSVPVKVIRGLLPVYELRPVGPPGIARFVSTALQRSLEIGLWYPILRLTALLNVALAVVNILPFPGLDGGRMLFIIIEAIRGKRVDPRKEGLVHLIGMVALICLLLIVSFYDIISPLPIPDW
jgi:regulator of sigma E protease